MRILIVADFYHHGSSRVVEDRALALALRGHEVEVLAGSPPDRIADEAAALRGLGLEPRLVPWVPAHRGPRALLGIVGAFRGAFRALASVRRPDAILFNQPLSAWASLSSPFSRGIPSVYTFHSPWPVEWEIERGRGERGPGRLRRAMEYGIRRWIEGRALGRASAITLLSDYMRSLLHEIHRGIPPEKVCLIPGGVDIERFRPADEACRRARKAAMGIPGDAPMVLSVRRLVPRMGLEALLGAFRILRGRIDGVHLCIGGAGPLDGHLRREAKELGIAESVRFLGFVPDESLPGLYAAADLFVLPTAELEGFGLVTAEALACSTPVVGTPVGATPGILRGIDRRLVAAETSPRAIAAAAGAILDLPPVSRRAIGAMGRRRMVLFHDARKVGDRLDFLVSAVAGRIPGQAGGRRARSPAWKDETSIPRR